MSIFKEVKTDIDYLFPKSIKNYLPDDHKAWIFHDIFKTIDISSITKQYSSGGREENNPSAMMKRGRITLEDARTAVNEYYNIPVKFIDIDLKKALDLSKKLNIYAYDAYFIQCALESQQPLITLDTSLINKAESAGVEIREVAL